jgi:hypothetical protein
MQDNGGNSGPSSPRRMMKYNSYWGKASRELCAGSGLCTRLEAKQTPEADCVSYDMLVPLILSIRCTTGHPLSEHVITQDTEIKGVMTISLSFNGKSSVGRYNPKDTSSTRSTSWA